MMQILASLGTTSTAPAGIFEVGIQRALARVQSTRRDQPPHLGQSGQASQRN